MPEQTVVDPAAPDLLFRCFTEVMILAHLTVSAFESAMQNRLTMAQFSVLNHLARTGDGQTPVTLAKAMQVRKSTMTSTLGTLAQAGLVMVVPDTEDRRSKRVHLTASGRAARDAAIDAVTPEMIALGQRISQSDLSNGLPLLEQLRHVMDSRRIPQA